MTQFIKKYKYLFIFSIIAVVVLTSAFFIGNNKNNSSISTADTAKISITEKNNSSSIEISSSKETINDDNQPTTNKQTTNKTDKKYSKPSTSPSEATTKVSSKNENKSSLKSANNQSSNNKPKPVEPQKQEIQKDTTLYCTFSISCATILNNLTNLDSDKLELVPDDGWILKPIKVSFNQGESVYDVLQRVCKDNNIHFEASWTPIYNTAYIEGINNLYEFDCGEGSGWHYKVNDWFPNYGCSRYQLKNGDNVSYLYSCNFGEDINDKK